MPGPSTSSAAAATQPKQVTGTKVSCPARSSLLQLLEVDFLNCHQINKDTLYEFPSPEWVLGRAEQSPVCFTRNQKIKLTVKFKVLRAPHTTETVDVQGSAWITKSLYMKWTGQVTVRPTDTTVTLSDVTSDQKLPNWITFYAPFLIDWTYHPHGVSCWSTAGTSKNGLYVVLGDPLVSPLYWTVVDLSCRAANGRSMENRAVPAMYQPFKGAQASPPKPIHRKRDNVVMTYWLPETDEKFDTQAMLQNPAGCGRCGAWSHFFVEMCKAHGISSAQQVSVELYRNLGILIGMLVKNWSFTRTPDLRSVVSKYGQSFTHYVRERAGHQFILPAGVTSTGGCQDLPGVAAQGNPDPFPAFLDHAIVQHNGIYYDPSYGTKPARSGLQWEQQSLDGIFTAEPVGASGGYVALAAKHPGTQVFTFTPV